MSGPTLKPAFIFTAGLGVLLAKVVVVLYLCRHKANFVKMLG